MTSAPSILGPQAKMDELQSGGRKSGSCVQRPRRSWGLDSPGARGLRAGRICSVRQLPEAKATESRGAANNARSPLSHAKGSCNQNNYSQILNPDWFSILNAFLKNRGSPSEM